MPTNTIGEPQDRRAASTGWDEAEAELSVEEDLCNDRPPRTSFSGWEGAIASKPRSEEETFLPEQVRGGNAPGKWEGAFAGTNPSDTSLAAATSGRAFLLHPPLTSSVGEALDRRAAYTSLDEAEAEPMDEEEFDDGHWTQKV